MRGGEKFTDWRKIVLRVGEENQKVASSPGYGSEATFQ